MVLGRVKRHSKTNILSYGLILDPWCLLNIRCRTVHFNRILLIKILYFRATFNSVLGALLFKQIIFYEGIFLGLEILEVSEQR